MGRQAKMRRMRAGSSTRRPGSIGLVIDPELGRPVEVAFIECCHCGRHLPARETIGAMQDKIPVMEFCSKCNGVHCAAPECRECVPKRKQIDNVSAGRHKLDRTRLVVAGVDAPG